MQTGIGRTRGCNRRKGFERSGQDLWQNWQKYLNISNAILINKSMFTIEIIRIGYWAAILLAIAFKSFSLCWSWHAIVSQIVYYSSVRTNLRRHVRIPSVTMRRLLVTPSVFNSNWAINSKVEVFSHWNDSSCYGKSQMMDLITNSWLEVRLTLKKTRFAGGLRQLRIFFSASVKHALRCSNM